MSLLLSLYIGTQFLALEGVEKSADMCYLSLAFLPISASCLGNGGHEHLKVKARTVVALQAVAKQLNGRVAKSHKLEEISRITNMDY